MVGPARAGGDRHGGVVAGIEVGQADDLHAGLGADLLGEQVARHGSSEPALADENSCNLSPEPIEQAAALALYPIHVLEHVGQAPDLFRDIVRGIHRVMQPGGTVHVVVPDPSHDTFLNDPTHVRPITPEFFLMLSKARNAEWRAEALSCSPVAEAWNVDFEVVRIERELDPGFRAWAAANGITVDRQAVRFYRNAVVQSHIEMRALKS